MPGKDIEERRLYQRRYMRSWRNDDTIPPVEAAWLAAAIDGEGSITLLKNRIGGTAVVVVTNTDERFLRRAKRIMRARSITWSKPRPKGHVHSTLPCGRVSVHGRADVERVLNSVIPFLIIKLDKAIDVMEQFIDHPLVDIPEMRRREWSAKSPDEKAIILERLRKNRHPVIPKGSNRIPE